MDKLPEAQAEAKSRKVALTFVMSDPKTTCPLCAEASGDAMKTLKPKCVIVFVNSKVTEDWKQVPEIAQKALRSPESGQYIPKTVVLDAELTKVIDIIPYARDNERGKLLKEARKKLDAELTSAASAPVVAGKPRPRP
jgi:hypothetical protein